MSEPDVSQLLTVAQAIEIIDAAKVSLRVVDLALSDADQLVLARDVVADRDYPPFDKSQMDGFAVRSGDLPGTLRIVGEIAAGQSAARGLADHEAFAIMTGAPLPQGADAVVPVEHAIRDGDTVKIAEPTKLGRFIAKRGSDVVAGTVVLEAGARLGPTQLAVAGSVGANRVGVFAKPRAAVLSTGDELVGIDQVPGPAQIRNSNSLMLASLLKRLGCDVIDLGVVRDDPKLTRDALARGMQFDLLFVTGGMSMGEFDFVPRTLIELGVDLRITKLRIKPGKPFVFGVAEGLGCRVSGSGSAHSPNPTPDTLCPHFVFGLPGNPVSAFVCTVRLASRLIARLNGTTPREKWVYGLLTEPMPVNGPREFYQPVVFVENGGVKPLQWKGSADVFTLARADGLLARAENEPALGAGTRVRVLEI